MTKTEHYEQAKKNVIGKLNRRIADVINMPKDVIEKHPVVQIVDQENSLKQVTPFLHVSGVLREFASSLAVDKLHLINAIPDDADQQRWDKVLSALVLSRLILSEKFVAEMSEAIQADEHIPADQVRNSVLAVAANYTLISWQLLRSASSRVVADALEHYSGLHGGLADLGKLQDIVPFDENQKLLEFHDWLQPVLSDTMGLEQAILYQNLRDAMQKSIHNKNDVGLSTAQMVILYVNTYWLGDMIQRRGLELKHEKFTMWKFSDEIMMTLIAHHTLNDIYQSYRSVGWVKQESDKNGK